MSSSVSRSSGSLGPLYGEDWLGQLIHFEYDRNGKSTFSRHYNNRLHAMKLPTHKQIKNITLYKIDLEQIARYVDVLTHHYVVFATDDGFLISLEKIKTCILMQSCPPTSTTNSEFQLEEWRGGEKRKKLESMEIVKTREECRLTVAKVIDWVFSERELLNKYDIQSSNCQHFAARLWEKLTIVKGVYLHKGCLYIFTDRHLLSSKHATL